MTQKGLKLIEHKRRFCQPDLPTPADSTFVIFFEGFQIQISKSFVSVYIIAREFRKSLSLHLNILINGCQVDLLIYHFNNPSHIWRMSGGLVEGRRCLLHHLTLPHELVLCSRGDEMKTRNKHFRNTV